MKKKVTIQPMQSPWKKILLVLFGLWIISSFIAGMFALSTSSLDTGNVAVIPVHGMITVADAGFFDGQVAGSTAIVELIERADAAEQIQAIVLDINSPGGTAVASEEISRAIHRANKTTIAIVREVGASGGFWVATSADHVFASPLSITGSIGVIASYLDFSEFIEEYNVSYERMVAGKYKDMGSPFRELSGAERKIFQDQLDLMHDYFVESVAQSRNLSVDHVKEDATGAIFLGSFAKERGYVDNLGDMYEVEQYLATQLETDIEFSKYEKQESFLDSLSQLRVVDVFGMKTGARILT